MIQATPLDECQKEVSVYREAARLAEEIGGDHLMAWWALQAGQDGGMDHTRQCDQLKAAFGDEYGDDDMSDEERALALCFVAAMLEDGDV